ncbi:uncharacterized protein SPAPADRAFT_142747 [Spathaspora passalidarum NRRL Y-27907]|uniref:Phosphatidylinositol 3-kinase VPS34 n=1 Tax=Spathaspora passalidarum (strain NRRL Y-27907 / 11-Y1) TaxID=619300 RepID=G3AT57_SPAPN|nr:uncharacterized protein SPAPADRAFT_142747 [Spathaspora passalidarum NRRL Y-27907]EGW30820.1 hypothetical protein SPAPADRAFT_142747 [Spathaspora passalidarum NRRL Y-27907]
MTATTEAHDALTQVKLSNTFGLSKDLTDPIIVKICYLEPTLITQHESIPLSTKFENPSVFKTSSRIYKNSDLFIRIGMYDGKNNNLIAPVSQTTFTHFRGRRVWNQYVKLAMEYNQICSGAYLKFVIYEIVDCKSVVFGVGYLSMFNHTRSTLRSGSQKVAINTKLPDKPSVDYGDPKGLTELETNLIKFENGEFNRVNWLDKLVLPKLTGGQKSDQEEINTDADYFLYVELPNFEFPIVYSDIKYEIPTIPKFEPKQPENSSIVINSVDISSEGSQPKVYDPDFQIATRLNHINATTTIYDPIELKYHKLERNINNNTMLDKELKPTPQLRDELLRILVKPSNIELNDYEKNLIWKFRYYFSKNNQTNIDSRNKTTTQSFLPKFLKSIDWDNDYEVDHAFNEIIPNYWGVNNLQIGDALELLGDYFNPFVLGRSMYPVEQPQRDSSKLKDDEKRFLNLFKNVTLLRKLAVDRLRLASSDELLLYLLQLVQALKYESLIYERKLPFDEIDLHHHKNNGDPLESPLAKFLIDESVHSEKLGNFFYWYVKVENEDQLNTRSTPPQERSPFENTDSKMYGAILNKYIDNLKKHCHEHRLPYYKHLKRQIWFIKKLTGLVELLRSSFRKNESTMRKTEFLKEYLSNSSNELLKFPDPFPLPLDPSIMICGCYPEESAVFKSSLAPLKITLKTIESGGASRHSATSQIIFGKKHNKYGKYPMMFKIGDDLRQDQLVIQIIDLMDQLLKNENLDLKLTPYKILATSPVAGLIQFVPNETLDSILSKTYPEISRPTSNQSSANSGAPQVSTPTTTNGILNYLQVHSRDQQESEPTPTHSILGASHVAAPTSPPSPRVQPKPAITSNMGVSPVLMDNYVKSCAGYCVITYILGVGDRHLDNLLLSPNGKFWHADFGYILGRDPKPFPPLMKLPIQVIHGMGGLQHENYNIFKSYCFITYTTLRKNSNLILNLFQLMLDANIPDIKFDRTRAIEKVQDKFCLQMTEEEAILHFQNLINDSVSAFMPVVIDRLHSLAQYWRA